MIETVRVQILPEGTTSALRYLALILILLLAAVSLFPLYWAIVTSFKHPQDVATVPPSFALTRPVLKNYIDLIQGTGVANAPVVRWFWNSVFTSVVSTAGVVLLASLAGYSFARKQFPGRDKIFWLVISTMLVPAWSTIIAIYVLTLRMGLHDTYWALILPGLASPFAVFLLRQFAITLPEELFQAAKIDGASELQLWWRITLPLSKPVLATLAIFTFVAHWNDFLWPLLVLNKQQIYTLPVGVSIIMYQIQGAGPSYGIGMAAAILMSVLPIIAFLLMQRQMIEGITIGSLKG
ncbi:carbohydrate ABC transporter permease [Chloroflexi bacterium TSY]|nr:carbohydrate ABC transporter permease [Chloroflexi bacterium TSY]